MIDGGKSRKLTPKMGHEHDHLKVFHIEAVFSYRTPDTETDLVDVEYVTPIIGPGGREIPNSLVAECGELAKRSTTLVGTEEIAFSESHVFEKGVCSTLGTGDHGGPMYPDSNWFDLPGSYVNFYPGNMNGAMGVRPK